MYDFEVLCACVEICTEISVISFVCLVLASSSSSSLMSSLSVVIVINAKLSYAPKIAPSMGQHPIGKKPTKNNTMAATSTSAICFQISGLFHFTGDYKKCFSLSLPLCVCVCACCYSALFSLQLNFSARCRCCRHRHGCCDVYIRFCHCNLLLLQFPFSLRPRLLFFVFV